MASPVKQAQETKGIDHPPPPPPRYYLGYGSNLWREQMTLRCPCSRFVGVGRLRRYRWMINERGYANVAPVTGVTPLVAASLQNKEEEQEGEEEEEEEVWGLIYTLTKTDEKRLDVNEGVPFAYEKRVIECEFWEDQQEQHDLVAAAESEVPVGEGDAVADKENIQENDHHDRMREKQKKTQQKMGRTVKMLVYIDFKRASGEGTQARAEYVHRMNMGIRDALRAGVPRRYVDGVMRRWIPEEAEEERDKDKERVRELARSQAVSFQDESGVIPPPSAFEDRPGSGFGV